MPSIDTHFHVFSSQRPAAAQARYRPAYDAPIAQWRALAGACGVSRGVLVQPSFLGADHHDLLTTLLADPVNLRGVATLSPATDAACIGSFHQSGVRGLRWNLAGASEFAALADGRWNAVLDACLGLRWHLELHTDSDRLAPLLRALPPCPLPVVIDHFGKPAATADSIRQTLAAAGALARQRPVYMKLSAPYRSAGVDHASLARAWRDLLGPQRLLWGSDWPWTNHEGQHRYDALHGLWHDWFGSGEQDGAAAMARQADLNACGVFDWPLPG